MEVVGLDVRAGSVLGVVVNGDGAVLRRSRLEGDLETTVPALWRELQRESAYAAVGLSADDDLEGFTLPPSLVPGTIPVHRCSPGPAAITAEAWAGAARNSRHAICLWAGDRVFAGTLLDGQPWLGAHGLAGAAAWLALNPVERQDYRKYGSLAAEISSKGIARRLAWRIQAGDHSAVLERVGDLDAITAAHVFDGARGGDGVAVSVVRDTARYVGMALSNLVAAIDPEVTVLAGALAKAGDLILEPARQECLRRLSPALAAHFRLEISPLAEEGVAIGAASLALNASHT